jgi:hypothetical protein
MADLEREHFESKVSSEEIMENFSVVYEDGEIVVYTAPTEDELKRILLDLLNKHERMTIRDLHSYLSGLASEDKIRYALNKLMKENLVVVDREGYYYPASVYEEYRKESEEFDQFADFEPPLEY